MPIVRPSYTDDTGDGESGDIINVAVINDLCDRIDALFAPMRLTGEQTLALAAGNNHNVVLNAGVSILTVSSAAGGSTLTGLTGGLHGRIVAILNIGSGNLLTITGEDAGSTAENRFTPGATIAGGECVLAIYTNRWRLFTGI